MLFFHQHFVLFSVFHFDHQIVFKSFFMETVIDNSFKDFFSQSVGVAGMKVEEFDGSHFSANPDIFKRINALLDHSLDITVPISLQGQDRKRGKHIFFLLPPLPPLLPPPLQIHIVITVIIIII